RVRGRGGRRRFRLLRLVRSGRAPVDLDRLGGAPRVGVLALAGRGPLPRRTEDLAGLRRRFAVDALAVHPIGDRVREVADRDEEGDEERRRRHPLQRGDVAVDQQHREDEQRRPDRGPFHGPPPGRRLDHALTSPRRGRGSFGGLRARVGLPVLLLGAKLGRVDGNLVPFADDADVFVLVPPRFLLPASLLSRGHQLKGNAAGVPASTTPPTTFPARWYAR